MPGASSGVPVAALQKGKEEDVRNQKWVQRLALPVVAALGAVMLTTTTAEAVPSKCSTSRVDKDTFTGTCRSGTGTWRLRVDCDKAEPDSFSSWLKPGKTASEGCWWGKARGASIEVR
ncbi:hypothetical protein GCM10018987_20040 [Streptomyces cremeus]